MGRKPKTLETGRQKMHSDLRKRTLFSMRSTAIYSIREIEARLHSIVLSGSKKHRKEYKLKDISGLMGPLWPDENYNPEERGGLYRTKSIKQTKKFQINFFAMPLKGFLPPFQIEIHHRKDNNIKDLKHLLINIDSLIPWVEVSSVEYAIDQYCNNPLGVDLLFWVEGYSLYVPNQKKEVPPIGEYQISYDSLGKKSLILKKDDTVTSNNDITGENINIYDENEEDVPNNREDDDLNDKGVKALIWHIGQGRYKIYERGKDKKRDGKTWYYENFDRVRLEHTADTRTLRGNGIITLKDLIKKPKFYIINNNIWKFRKFKEDSSDTLIKEWEKRAIPFQYLLKNTTLLNPTQYTEDVSTLKDLREGILLAMKLFDENWD